MARFHYGGQAVMEGVMMRGKHHVAVAVRDPAGEIVTHEEALSSAIHTHPAGRWPFIRGIVMLWDTLNLGIRMLLFSANVALSADEGGEPLDEQIPEGVMWGFLAVSLGMGVALFFLIPLLLINQVDRYISSSLLSNIVEGVIRLAMLVGYLYVIGKWPDISRVFAYHGAEHKTINAYEAGTPLEPDAVQKHSTAHERCGTSFLLIVVTLSVVIFSFLGRPPLLLRILSRVVLIPVIAGISYELLKLSAAHRGKAWVRALIAPSLALQRLSTREPDRGMLEVAIVALKRVQAADASERALETSKGVSSLSPGSVDTGGDG